MGEYVNPSSENGAARAVRSEESVNPFFTILSRL